jgi:tetratricopeptide (TPR) repeat protein
VERRIQAFRRTNAARIFLVIVLLALPSLVAGVCQAAPRTAEERQALELLHKSEEKYNEGKFDEAITLLRQAYALHAEPVLLYNLGRSYESSGDLEHAKESYAAYLEHDPNAADRKSVEARIASLDRQIEERRALQRDRDEERQRAQRSRRAKQPEKNAAPAEKRSSSALPWLVGGAGVAVAGAGLVFGILAKDRQSQADEERYQADAAREQDKAKRLATIANISFVAGGVLFASGLGILWLSNGRSTGSGTLIVRQSF